jgi:hypothetical protein
VIAPDQWLAGETPPDISLLLSAALGACECWGLQADCGLCGGRGSAGWTRPDPELFEEFVRPAIEKLPKIPVHADQRGGGVSPDDENNDAHQATQGENA